MSDLVFVEERPVAGREHSVQPGTTIGRADCDILLPDPDVSRKHAVIRQIDEGLGIEDLGSTNGTFVDEKRISGITELRAGATVRFGNTVWHLQTTAGATRIATGEEAAAVMEGTHVSSPPPPQAPPSPQAPPEPQPQPAQEAHAPPAPVAAAPAQAPPAAAPDGKRGDVPAPEIVPSQIRRVIPLPGQVPPFSVPDRGVQRVSAARRLEATIVCYAVVIATAVAVTVYFIER